MKGFIMSCVALAWYKCSILLVSLHFYVLHSKRPFALYILGILPKFFDSILEGHRLKENGEINRGSH